MCSAAAAGIAAGVGLLGRCRWGAVEVQPVALEVLSFLDAACCFEEGGQVIGGEVVSSGDTVAQHMFCLFQSPLIPQQLG